MKILMLVYQMVKRIYIHKQIQQCGAVIKNVHFRNFRFPFTLKMVNVGSEHTFRG